MEDNPFRSNVENMLSSAAECGRPTLVKKYLEAGANPNKPVDARWGVSILQQAIHRGNSKCVELLLEAGADPATVDHDQRNTLHHAAMGRGGVAKIECLQLLLAHAPDLFKPPNINKQDRLGQTPIFYAANNSHQEVVKFLLHHGANPHIKNHQGLTPQKAAERNPQNKVAKTIRRNYLQQILNVIQTSNQTPKETITL